MSIIKKIFAVIISLGLLLALSSCGFRFGPPPASPSAVSSPEASPSAEASASESTPSEAPETSNTPAPDSTPSDMGSTGLQRGVWNDDVYTNDFAKIHFTLPEGWTVTTDEEIASITGLGAEVMGDDNQWLIEAAKLTTIYDMMAQDPTNGDNITVMYENLSLSVGGMRLDEAEYIDAFKKQMENLDSLKYSFDDPYNTTIGSTDYLTVHADESIRGISQYFLVHKQDKYMIVIMVTITGDKKLDDILAYLE